MFVIQISGDNGAHQGVHPYWTDDTAFLDTIATNAMAWYDQHLTPAAVAEQIADEVLRIMEEEVAPSSPKGISEWASRSWLL